MTNRETFVFVYSCAKSFSSWESSKMEEEEKERRKKWPWMKSAQLLEFQMQALVYRYIEAGLRVPQHLMVPISNSLASSNYSSSLLRDKGLNHLNTVGRNEEPTRCWRTDGKKWRCSNTVLPFQKYCERHIHRGRKRSRKLVESSYEVASTSAASTKHDNIYGLDRNNESQSVLHGTMSGFSNPQVVTIASLSNARACDNVTRPSLVISESTNKKASHGDRSRMNMEMGYDDDFISQRESKTCVRVVPLQGNERLPSIQKFFPEVSESSLEAAKFTSNWKNNIVARSREWKDIVLSGGLIPGILFSPDTVLQDRGGFRFQRVETDNEAGRCRRTDGKKWRCGKGALCGQKYCEKHMHRGIKKKHPVDTNSHESIGVSSLTVNKAARSVPCKDDEQKLSVSLMGIPLSRVSDEKSTSSCSTDTTITDTALRGEGDNEEILSLCSSGV